MISAAGRQAAERPDPPPSRAGQVWDSSGVPFLVVSSSVPAIMGTVHHTIVWLLTSHSITAGETLETPEYPDKPWESVYYMERIT